MTAGGSEGRRRDKRLRLAVPLVVHAGRRKVQGVLLDVSARGLKVLVEDELPVGTEVEISTAIEGRKLRVSAVVLRSVPHASPRWRHELGLELDAPSADLDALARR